MNRYLILAAAALALAACSNDESMENNSPMELRLTSGLQAVARAFTPSQDTQIAEDQIVLVWADDRGSTDTDKEYIHSWPLIADGKGGFSHDNNPKYFPQSGANIDIYAMHGNWTYMAEAEGTTFPTSAVDFKVAEDQKAAATDFYKSDLLYAVSQNVTRTSSPVSLTFYHMLSKVQVALKAGDGLKQSDLTNATVTIEGTKLAGKFTPKKVADLSAEDTRAGMVALSSDDTNTAKPITIETATVADDADFTSATYGECIIIPQALAQNTKFIKVTLPEKGELYYTLPNAVTFQSEKKYLYHITVNLTGLSLYSKEIVDWAAETGEGAYTGENGNAYM